LTGEFPCFHVGVDVYKAFHSVIAEVFGYKCMEDVSSDWWLSITSSLLFAGFGLHMLQSRHMEKSPSYSLHSLLLGENTGCKSDVVSRSFIIDFINLYMIFLSQVKKEVPLNQQLVFNELATSLSSQQSRNTLGHRILGVFGFEDEEPGEADCMVCYERLRSDAWMMKSNENRSLERVVFVVGPPTIMKFNKYSRVVQNTSYYVQLMI